MGAALTYARRYAPFTLVGIAGEDDLDAPDLMMPPDRAPAHQEPSRGGAPRGNGGLSGDQYHSRPVNAAKGSLNRIARPRKMLDPAASAAAREAMLGELQGITSAEEPAAWAHRTLGAKANLTAADAGRVETAFGAKLSTFANADGADILDRPLSQPAVEPQPPSLARRDTPGVARAPRSSGVDKSALAHLEPRRHRDKQHLKFVATKACLICGRRPADAHHLRFAQSRALGRKVSDEFTVPLCRGHHREVHRHGDEAAWWKRTGLDPIETARALWLQTHPLLETSDIRIVDRVASTIDPSISDTTVSKGDAARSQGVDDPPIALAYDARPDTHSE